MHQRRKELVPMRENDRKTDGQRMACTYCTEKWMTPAFQHFSAHMNKA